MRPIDRERRVQRSTNPVEALARWLDASRRKSNLRNLAIADDLGTLVSGSGSALECNELAAWAPIVLAGNAGIGASALRLTGVKLPGFEAYLCTEGECPGEPQVLREIAAGCARILGRTGSDEAPLRPASVT